MKQKKTKKKKQSMTPLVVVLAVVLVLAAALLGYIAVTALRSGAPASGTEGNATEAQLQETTEPAPTTELPVETTATDMVIQTPYGNLYYPSGLAKYMKVEQENEGKNVIYRFYAKIDDVEFTEIFSVWFGKKQELVCGTVRGEKGEVITVSIDMNLDIPQDDWHENMRVRTFSLQEGVNDLMARLDELDGFVKAGREE